MSKRGTVAALAARKGGEEFGDTLAKIDGQNQNGAELDDDGVHLPVPAGEIDVQQRFGETQVRRGADGKEFSQSFDDAQQDRQQIFVQNFSPGVVELLTVAAGPGFAGTGKILRIS